MFDLFYSCSGYASLRKQIAAQINLLVVELDRTEDLDSFLCHFLPFFSHKCSLRFARTYQSRNRRLGMRLFYSAAFKASRCISIQVQLDDILLQFHYVSFFPFRTCSVLAECAFNTRIITWARLQSSWARFKRRAYNCFFFQSVGRSISSRAPCHAIPSWHQSHWRG